MCRVNDAHVVQKMCRRLCAEMMRCADYQVVECFQLARCMQQLLALWPPLASFVCTV